MQRNPRILAFASLAITLSLLPPAVADEPASAGAAPKAVVPEPVADLGTVDRGETVTHDFVVRNEGDAPLELLEVRPGCGCTVASFDKVIAPGASGKVHAELDTSSIRSGSTMKAISVVTNDPDNAQLQLTLMVKITDYLIFNPGFARFIQGRGHPPGVVDNIFFSPNFPDLKIDEVTSPFPFLKVDVRAATESERRPEAAGNQWVLTLTLDYDQAPIGPLNGVVKVQTNHPRQPVGELRVSGFVRPLVAVTPAAADFGEIDLSAPTFARFLVQNFGADPLRVTGVEPGLPGAEGSFAPIEEGRKYKVEVSLAADMAKGPFSGEVKIKTDSSAEPVIVVPIKGTVK
jgi:Protein of unknown function (DUF1573)